MPATNSQQVLDPVWLQHTGEVTKQQQGEEHEREHDTNGQRLYYPGLVVFSVILGEVVHPLKERDQYKNEHQNNRQLDNKVHNALSHPMGINRR